MAIDVRFIGTLAEYDKIDAATIWGRRREEEKDMGIISIRNARDHKAALREIDTLLAVKKLTDVQSRRLDALTILVDAYEEKAFPMGGSRRADQGPHVEQRPHAGGSGRSHRPGPRLAHPEHELTPEEIALVEAG